MPCFRTEQAMCDCIPVETRFYFVPFTYVKQKKLFLMLQINIFSRSVKVTTVRNKKVSSTSQIIIHFPRVFEVKMKQWKAKTINRICALVIGWVLLAVLGCALLTTAHELQGMEQMLKGGVGKKVVGRKGRAVNEQNRTEPKYANRRKATFLLADIWKPNEEKRKSGTRVNLNR